VPIQTVPPHRCPGLLLPYKRAGQGSTRGHGQDTSQKPGASKQRHTTHRSTPQATTFVLSHFFFETWAQFPLSRLVTPTQALRCKEIQHSPLPARRRAFFCPNQDKSPCIPLTSPSGLGTRNTHSSVQDPHETEHRH
jgi:hypothetical protein